MKVNLVSDSGATKSEWVGLRGSEVVFSAKTTGINPYFQGFEEIRDIINHELLLEIGNKEVGDIHFYGAGCSAVANRDVVTNAISFSFPLANIAVSPDLLGAARALCGRQSGIACILGTGANSCLYDGKDIVENVASLGFILGDEGSGSHLGKLLLGDYLRQDMPDDIKLNMDSEFGLNKDQVLESVYQQETPAKFMAGFTRFIHKHKGSVYMSRLIDHSFSLFFEKNICAYQNHESLPIHFVGGIAFHFQEPLKITAAKYNFSIESIHENPMGGLTEYHKVL